MKSFTQTLEEMSQFTEFLEEDLENIQRVIETCEENNADVAFEIHAKAETCEESVKHSPVEMNQIIKTLVFIADEPIAILCPGDKRVSEEKLEDLTDSAVRMANPDEVEEATDYVIGGVSPFDLEIPIYMDESLLEHDEVRPAAGSRLVGAKINPEELQRVTGAETRQLAD